MFSSLFITSLFLALKGDYGNGAVVLMDAKQEWPPLWRAAFENIGVPFYGFDGTYLTNQDKLKKREISQSGKVSIVNFKESVTQGFGGMMLMMALYNVIQKILKESGCKDVKTFNKLDLPAFVYPTKAQTGKGIFSLCLSCVCLFLRTFSNSFFIE